MSAPSQVPPRWPRTQGGAPWRGPLEATEIGLVAHLATRRRTRDEEGLSWRRGRARRRGRGRRRRRRCGRRRLGRQSLEEALQRLALEGLVLDQLLRDGVELVGVLSQDRFGSRIALLDQASDLLVDRLRHLLAVVLLLADLTAQEDQLLLVAQRERPEF